MDAFVRVVLLAFSYQSRSFHFHSFSKLALKGSAR